jgi:hypothetical protein
MFTPESLVAEYGITLDKAQSLCAKRDAELKAQADAAEAAKADRGVMKVSSASGWYIVTGLAPFTVNIPPQVAEGLLDPNSRWAKRAMILRNRVASKTLGVDDIYTPKGKKQE